MQRIALALIVALLGVTATAEITYPVDVENTRWALLDTDTGELIQRNMEWPVLDGGPVPGLASNLVFLLHVTDVVPDYDSRVYVLNSTETVDAPNNMLVKAFTAERRPTEEIVVAAENREVEELDRLGVRMAREVIETRLMVGALIQFTLDGQTLPPKVQTYADRYKAKAVQMWNNRDRLKELIAAIEASEDFDLDAGWEEPSE